MLRQSANGMKISNKYLADCGTWTKKKKVQRELGGKNREEEEQRKLTCTWLHGGDWFFFFFFNYLFMPAEISIPGEIDRNWPEWPKLVEMGRKFFRGGIKGFLVPVCTPVRDFAVGTERYSQLQLRFANLNYIYTTFLLKK